VKWRRSSSSISRPVSHLETCSTLSTRPRGPRGSRVTEDVRRVPSARRDPRGEPAHASQPGPRGQHDRRSRSRRLRRPAIARWIHQSRPSPAVRPGTGVRSLSPRVTSPSSPSVMGRGCSRRRNGGRTDPHLLARRTSGRRLRRLQRPRHVSTPDGCGSTGRAPGPPPPVQQHRAYPAPGTRRRPLTPAPARAPARPPPPGPGHRL